MRKISSNIQGYLLFCAVLFCCGRAGSAELLGSSNPEIRKNFNQLLTTNACRGCNLSGVVLDRLNLTEANLEGADLSSARLNKASLIRANLHNAVLRGASLGGADLTGANLLGADMEGADFTLDGKTATGSLGQQATVSAQDAVNSALNNLFTAQPVGTTSTTDGQKQVEATTKPPEEVSVLFAPFESPADEAQLTAKPPTQRNVDEIPVIQTEALSQKKEADDSRLWSFLFKMQEKIQRDSKAAPAESGAAQPKN
jgi:hypothetical protein